MTATTRRSTKIRLAAREVIILRRPQKHRAPFCCGDCEEDSVLLSLDEAILLTRVSSRTIHRWIEAQSIHFAETAEGFVLICSVTLLKHPDVDSLVATP